MINLLIIVFAITLVYLSVTERARSYNKLLALQGLLLFFIAFLMLKEIDITHLLFILAETLIFKSIAVPYFITRIINRNKIQANVGQSIPGFVSLIIVSCGILLSFIISEFLHEGLAEVIFFAIAVSSVFTGLLMIVVHKQLITHLMGYLIIENGIFLLSLAIGSEMPMMVNIAILLDIFSSILILGIFVNKVGNIFKELDIDRLNELTD